MADLPDGADPAPGLGLPDIAELRLTARGVAVLLDFDGTLVDIAARPDEVVLRPTVKPLLVRLSKASNGALAIVTGRAIEDIDAYLRPLKLPVAGVHGLVRRSSSGAVTTAPFDAGALDCARRKLLALAARREGLVVETKPGSVALHFRARPDLEADCLSAVEAAVAGQPGLNVQRGKMVAEIKAARVSKAEAIAAFMAEPPFRGRLPVFAGDDVTDEDAFREVAGRGGVAIKVGDGATTARYRVRGTGEFLDWLGVLAADLEPGAARRRGG